LRQLILWTESCYFFDSSKVFTFLFPLYLFSNMTQASARVNGLVITKQPSLLKAFFYTCAVFLLPIDFLLTSQGFKLVILSILVTKLRLCYCFIFILYRPFFVHIIDMYSFRRRKKIYIYIHFNIKTFMSSHKIITFFPFTLLSLSFILNN